MNQLAEQRSQSQDRKHLLMAFGLSYLFFFMIAWCSPYSSDDLEFANLPYTAFSEYLSYALGYGNGRLLGNLCSIWLSNSRILCVLVKPFVQASIVVLIPVLLELREKQYYLASFLLIATIEPAVFGEVFAWTSGFSNYVPCIWMSMVIVYLVKRYSDIRSLPVKLLVCLCVFVLGVASQLFIEHSSGINVLLALVCTAWNLKRRDWSRAVVSSIWLVATVLGLFLMLAIPVVFFNESGRAVGYRSVHLGGVRELLYSFGANAIQLSNHYFGACTLPIIFGAYVTICLTREKRKEKGNAWLFTANSIAFIYLVLSFVLSLDGYLGKAGIIQHLISGVFVLVPFLVWAVAALGLEGKLRFSMLTLLTFALISLVPLLVVSPIPDRVIFQAHVFIIMAAMLCIRELFGQLDEKWSRRLAKSAVAVCLTLVVLLGTVFASIRFMSQARENHIRRELDAGATEILIFMLPYEYTSWDHLWGQAFYNDTGRDVTFSSVPFTYWMDGVY